MLLAHRAQLVLRDDCAERDGDRDTAAGRHERARMIVESLSKNENAPDASIGGASIKLAQEGLLDLVGDVDGAGLDELVAVTEVGDTGGLREPADFGVAVEVAHRVE